MKKIPVKVKIMEEAVNPHSWMAVPAVEKPPAKKESIRQWYTRTTGWAMKAIIFVTFCSLSTIGIMWCVASLPMLQRLQTANGALTIPLIGGVWIFGFIFMFLIPSREASFRGQESLEEAVDIVRQAMREQIAPAAAIWGRIGDRLESQLPSMIQQVTDTLDDLRKATKKIEMAAQRNESLVDEAKPAIDALKRIEHRLEVEINGGFIENVKAAVDSVKMMSGVPKDASEPDYGFLQKSLKSAKARSASEGKTS